MKQYKSHGDSPFVGHGEVTGTIGHGDGPFVSVPLFVLLTVGNQGDRYKRTVPLFPFVSFVSAFVSEALTAAAL